MKLLPILALAALAACGSTVTRLEAPAAAPALSLTSRVGSVVVRDVILPTYAAGEELALETEPGVITSDGELLAADDPSRAMTLAVASRMDAILNAVVSPEPWPFPGLSDVIVDIRVSQALGSAVTGTYTLAGQYFIGGDAIDFPMTAQSFSYQIPLRTRDIPGAVQAQSIAVAQLSEEISRRLSR